MMMRRGFLRLEGLPRAALLGLALGLAPVFSPLAMAQSAPARPVGQERFSSPDAACAALIAALRRDDTGALLKILGPGGEKLVVTGDPIAARAARQRFLSAYAQRHALQAAPDGDVSIVVGDDRWPLPIPIVKAGESWRFDATTGAQEILDRQIGRDELLTIRTLLSAAAAQHDYFARMKRADGAGVYARRLFSTPGTHDGLYWAVSPGQEESPLGPLVTQAEEEGYPGATQEDGAQIPYQGYYFRLLTAQGPDAPEGAMDYIRAGRMTQGFAYVAWPAYYGRSGIMTFIINQDGDVFQKNLGRDTAKKARAMTAFNPDLSWTLVQLGK